MSIPGEHSTVISTQRYGFLSPQSTHTRSELRRGWTAVADSVSNPLRCGGKRSRAVSLKQSPSLYVSATERTTGVPDGTLLLVLVKRASESNAAVVGSGALGRFRVVPVRGLAADLPLPRLSVPSPLLGPASASATVDVITPLAARPDLCLGSQGGAQRFTLRVCKYSFALSFLGCIAPRNSEQVSTKCPRLVGLSGRRWVIGDDLAGSSARGALPPSPYLCSKLKHECFRYSAREEFPLFLGPPFSPERVRPRLCVPFTSVSSSVDSDSYLKRAACAAFPEILGKLATQACLPLTRVSVPPATRLESL